MLFSKAFAAQPQFPALPDLSNPLTGSATRIYAAHNGTMREITQRYPVAWTKTGTPGFTTGQGGYKATFASGSALAVSDTAAYNKLGSAFTFFLDCEYVSGTGGYLFGAVQAESFTGRNAGLYVTGSKQAVFVVENTAHASVGATEAISLPSGRQKLVGTYDGATIRLYRNGMQVATAAQTGGINTASYQVVFNRWNSSSALTFGVYSAGIVPRVWTPAEVAAWTNNPWQIFAPIQRALPTYSAGGGAGSVTGTLAATLDDVAASASGVVGHSGTTSATLGDVSATFAGTTGHPGTLAATLSDVTASASGVTGHPGSLSATLDSVSVSASGTVSTAGAVSGSLSATLADITASISGTVGHSGTASATLDGITPAIAGIVGHPGALSGTLDGVTVAFSGSVTSQQNITGTMAVTLDGITAQMSSGGGAGGYEQKKRKVIIHGRRLEVTEDELRNILAREIRNAEKPEETPQEVAEERTETPQEAPKKQREYRVPKAVQMVDSGALWLEQMRQADYETAQLIKRISEQIAREIEEEEIELLLMVA